MRVALSPSRSPETRRADFAPPPRGARLTPIPESFDLSRVRPTADRPAAVSSPLQLSAAPTQVQRQEAEDSSGISSLGGFCIRTPFPPGQLRFHGLNATQLADFAVMPESGSTTTTPVNGVWYDADGCWYRNHTPKTEWLKVPSHCDADVTLSGGVPVWESCCNIAASLYGGAVRWSGTGHKAKNPF